MSSERVINFAPGPAKVPEEVIQKAHSEFLLYKNEGISAIELTHRGPAFAKIINEAESTLRDIMHIPSNYKVLFMHGGATGQFSAVPLNLCPSRDCVADYFVTGAWSSKAAKEAEKYCRVNRVLPKTDKYTGIPSADSWKLSPNASYVYYCGNETIHGVEFDFVPECNGVPLVCDMSSHILSRPVDVSKFAIIFAGAQKNAGIPGVTIVIVRDDLLDQKMDICPIIFDYKLNADNKSLYNTPSTFSIYVMGLVFQWVKDKGGIEAMDAASQVKSELVYELFDSSNGFYCSPIEKRSRSRMNIPFRIGGPNGDEELEKEFLDLTRKNNMVSLKGHRSVGGIRISLFNAVTLEETQELVNLMKDFYKSHKEKS